MPKNRSEMWEVGEELREEEEEEEKGKRAPTWVEEEKVTSLLNILKEEWNWKL